MQRDDLRKYTAFCDSGPSGTYVIMGWGHDHSAYTKYLPLNTQNFAIVYFSLQMEDDWPRF